MLLYDLTQKDIELIIIALEDAVNVDHDRINKLIISGDKSLISLVQEKLDLKIKILKVFRDILTEQYIAPKHNTDREIFKNWFTKKAKEEIHDIIRPEPEVNNDEVKEMLTSLENATDINDPPYVDIEDIIPKDSEQNVSMS